jgi:hypothetical protein
MATAEDSLGLPWLQRLRRYLPLNLHPRLRRCLAVTTLTTAAEAIADPFGEDEYDLFSDPKRTLLPRHDTKFGDKFLAAVRTLWIKAHEQPQSDVRC